MSDRIMSASAALAEALHEEMARDERVFCLGEDIGIPGGWGGGTVGLSNIDGYSAVENETTTFTSFENSKWYRIRLQVTTKRIEGWIDDARKFSVERKGQKFAIWPQQEPSKPLGITTYYTKAALRELKFKSLGPAE